MKQYWAFGKVKNALLPMYVNSGGPGKEKNWAIKSRKATKENTRRYNLNWCKCN